MRLKHWALLVKSTNDCNLNCLYCYNKPFQKQTGKMRMSFEMVDHILALAEQYAEEVHWIWHGGESTLMGIEWFQKVQELFYKHYQTQFQQSMQSNGVLLDERWAKLSQDYGIEIGVSYDVFNQDIRLGSQMAKIENNLKKYANAGGRLGTITVINRLNFERQIELYEYFKENFEHTPAFNHIYRTDGSLSNDLEMNPEDFEREFKKYLLYWINDASPKALSERSLMLMLKQVAGNREMVCTYSDCRRNWIGVNPNGDIYPCDRYLPERYKAGNIMDFSSINDIYASNGHHLYSLEATKRFATHCAECGYFSYCQGGCNANHIAVSGNNADLDTTSCSYFKRLYNATYDTLRSVDIYETSLNKHFLEFVLQEPVITFKEIREFLATKGLTKVLDYSPNGKALLSSPEFQIFRLFNVFKGMSNGHVDIIVNARVLVDSHKPIDWNFIRKERLKSMETVYANHTHEILNLFEG